MVLVPGPRPTPSNLAQGVRRRSKQQAVTVIALLLHSALSAPER